MFGVRIARTGNDGVEFFNFLLKFFAAFHLPVVTAFYRSRQKKEGFEEALHVKKSLGEYEFHSM